MVYKVHKRGNKKKDQYIFPSALNTFISFPEIIFLCILLWPAELLVHT